MNRSIFAKLVSLLMTVVLLSVVLTGVLFGFSMQRYFIRQKTDLLEQAAKRTVSTLEIYLENRGDAVSPLLFTNFIESLAANVSAMIWIVTDDGELVLSSQIPDVVMDKLPRSTEGYRTLPDERQYAPVPQGETAAVSQGDFYGLFRESGVDWLTIRTPFSITVGGSSSDAEVTGQVMLHTRMPEIRATQQSIIRMFSTAAAVGILISFIVGFLFSRHLSNPIQRMNRVARRIASGEFTEKIPISGKDEVWQLAENFNHMVQSLEQLETLRRDFVSNVSHELRTPITTIKGFVEGILDGTIPQERQQTYLRIVCDETNRMKRMVNDLLDLTKLESGAATLNRTSFDINELIRICVISMSQQLEDKNLMFDADFVTDRLFVRADRDAIQRVLLNLMGNAVKFTPDGGEIRVRTRQERDHCHVEVSDTGTGISEADLPFVFDRFYKTDKSRSTDRTGLGLGLAITKNILTAHGETIFVESGINHGTTFHFTLQAAPERVDG